MTVRFNKDKLKDFVKRGMLDHSAVDSVVLAKKEMRTYEQWKGWAVVGGQRCYLRSEWEYNIACYFEFLKSLKEVTEWRYEPKTFWFLKIKRGVRSYKPDFWVKYIDGHEVYFEVKGYMDSRSKTKIKRMAKYYPEIVLEVIDQKRYNSIMNSCSSLIGDFGKVEEKRSKNEQNCLGHGRGA